MSNLKIKIGNTYKDQDNNRWTILRGKPVHSDDKEVYDGNTIPWYLGRLEGNNGNKLPPLKIFDMGGKVLNAPHNCPLA